MGVTNVLKCYAVLDAVARNDLLERLRGAGWKPDVHRTRGQDLVMCADPKGEPGDWDYVDVRKLQAKLEAGDVFGMQIVDERGAHLLLRVEQSTGTVTLDFNAGCPMHPDIGRCIDASWAVGVLHAIASALRFKPCDITVSSLSL